MVYLVMGCRNVKVTVQGNQISLDPATVTVTPRSPPVKIVWYLATPGYRFVDLANDRPVNFAAQYFMLACDAVTRQPLDPE